MDIGHVVFVILMAVSLSACAGLRAFLPPLAVPLLALSGYVTLAPQFAWMGRWEVALVFGLAVLIELAADKYPGVDNLLDAAGIVIKPLMGALLASSIITGLDPLLALAVGIILGGGLAGAVHLGKAKLRLLSTSFTGGLANPIISFIEDALAVVWTLIAAWLPVITGVAALLGVLWIARLLWRHARRHPAEGVGV